MFIVISNNIINLKRFQVILIMGCLGIISFLLLSIFIQKVLSKNYELFFSQNDLLIKSKNEEIISYSDMKSIVIYNNSDYSNIIIDKKNGNRIKFFVGMANLLKNKDILQPKNILDSVLKNNFDSEVKNIKGIEIILYKKR